MWFQLGVFGTGLVYFLTAGGLNAKSWLVGALVSLLNGLVFVAFLRMQHKKLKWNARASLMAATLSSTVRLLLVILLLAAAFFILKTKGIPLIFGFISGQLGFIADRFFDNGKWRKKI